MTGKSKLHGGALSVLIAVQLGFGIYFVFVNGVGPGEFLNCLFVRVWSHRPPVQPAPEINLDAYKVCFPKRWHLGELVFAGITVVFGKPL